VRFDRLRAQEQLGGGLADRGPLGHYQCDPQLLRGELLGAARIAVWAGPEPGRGELSPGTLHPWARPELRKHRRCGGELLARIAPTTGASETLAEA
jgi:hypothetical protein